MKVVTKDTITYNDLGKEQFYITLKGENLKRCIYMDDRFCIYYLDITETIPLSKGQILKLNKERAKVVNDIHLKTFNIH